MDKKQIGNLTELQCLTSFVSLGYNVSIPYGDNAKYDFIADIQGKLIRVQVKTASEEMAIGNKQILDEVRNLQNATAVMKSSMEEMSVGATKINETGASLMEIEGKMQSSINQIGTQIDQFKV